MATRKAGDWSLKTSCCEGRRAKHIDETGGPLWRHARDEQEHAVYDAVCRRLYQFLTGTKS